MSSSLLNKILSSSVTSTPTSNRACSRSNNHEDDDGHSSSRFQRTVCLYDWWLVKAVKDFQGKRLAVAGFTSRELQAVRVFNSAPIVKRYDLFTLESADGICIVVKGFINKSRTLANGFSSEVFSHFMFGFPPCWEAYNERCLGKEFTNATGSATFPDFNESASVPKYSAVAGSSNSIPTRTPSKHLESMSERITTNASRGPDSPNHTAECSNTDKTNNCTLENLPPSISCETNAVCDIYTISSIENNLAVQAQPSSYNATESSGRVANSKDSMKGKEGTVRKSKTKQPACLESTITPNAALEASQVLVNSVYNPSPSNMGPVVSRENSGVELMATYSSPKTLEEQKENDKNEDVLDCGTENCSNVSSPQDCECIVRCSGEKTNVVERSNLWSFDHEVRQKDSLSTPPSGRDTNVPDSSNRVGDGMASLVLHPASSINSVTPSKVDVNAVNTAPNNSGSQKTSHCLRNWKGNQKENSGSDGSVKSKSDEASEELDGENLKRYDLRNLICNQKEHSGFKVSVKCKRKEILSEASQVLDRENLKRCSSTGAILCGSKTDMLGATQSQSVSRIFRNLLDNLKGNEKERQTVICGLKANSNEINSSSVNSDRTSKIVKNYTSERMNVFNFGEDDLQEPICSTFMKDNSKQRRGCGKISLDETPRQKSNNLDQSHSGLDRTNHPSDLKTAVGEKDRKAKEVGSSRRKTRRKINFDTHASPLTQEREEKVSIISPDSLSLKRSRSGRLLLPSLEFWRNQVAVYDADRKITGIQEAADDVKLSKGSKSEPRKKRRFNA